MVSNISQNTLKNTGPIILPEYREWISAIKKCASRQQYRAVIVIRGELDKCCFIVNQLINMVAINKSVWLSEVLPATIHPKHAATLLGKEHDVVVFDMHSGFDADAFGIISNTLSGGGLLFLLMPDIDRRDNPESSRYLKRVMSIINGGESIHDIDVSQFPPELECSPDPKPRKSECPHPYRSDEQKKVVESIYDMANEEQHKPVVIMSDRGRGKSAALGLAGGLIIKHGLRRVVVTAPRLSISETIFRHARQICLGAESYHGRMEYQGFELVFIAPDALTSELKANDILLIDEAASIPLPMLEDLLNRHKRIVFATTVHGYEGTGRGFILKFDKVLDRIAPSWQLFVMHTPVRWAVGDPVEAWVDHLLCLDSEMADLRNIEIKDCSKCRVVLQNRDELVNDEARLTSLFALLVNAHYRTRPSDLLYMLDAPNVRIYTLEYHNKIIGAVLINEEGGFDAELSHLIYMGERRPNGHLLAQTLCFHAGCEAAARLKYSRIMRIAVHPEVQRQGLGSRLLSLVIDEEKRLDIDAIGTSFGATPELLNFWKLAEFEMVRLGFSRDHASGTHSAVLLLPLTIEGDRVFRDVRSRFQRCLPVWIDEIFSNISDDMMAYLNQEKLIDDVSLTDDDLRDARSFAYSHRGYETCMWALKKLVGHYQSHVNALADNERAIINARISQKMDWPDTVKLLAGSGKAEMVKLLRRAISSLIEEVGITEK